MSLINKKAIRQFALEVAKTRAHKFTRVSADFLEVMDIKMRNEAEKYIKSLPSVGRTIK